MIPTEEEYAILPDHIRSGVKRYIEDGQKPGSFLCAVISNNLLEATVRADSINLPRLKEIMQFLFNYCPDDSWGSETALQKWVDHEGLKGI